MLSLLPFLLWLVPAHQDPAPEPRPDATTEAAVPEATVPIRPPAQSDLSFEGALTGARDGEDFQETPGYRRLLDILTRYDAAELQAKAERRLDVPAALLAPEEWRGRIVRVRGIVAGMTTERLLSPIGERQDVYRAVITEPDGSQGVVVDFLLPPPALDLQRDVVDVEGVFFRLVRYEAKRGNTREAAYLIARQPRVLDTDSLPRRTGFDQIGLWFVGVAVAFLSLRILYTLRKKKGRRDNDARRSSELLRARARAATELPRQTPKP